MRLFLNKILILSLILFATNCSAATKITELTEDTSPTSDDLTITVNDPAGTPANKKVTLSNMKVGALLANGANCSSGQAPLGVDASGAVESCFDVWTESENTAASYMSTSDTEMIDSDMYVDASIDHEHLSADAVSGMTDVTSTDSDFLLGWDATDSSLKKFSADEFRGGGISGTDTHVIFFDGANNPAGDAGMTYNKTTDALTVVGPLTVSYVTTTNTTGSSSTYSLEVTNDLEIPNGTADVALTAAGQIYLNETDEQLAIHSGSNGEISGEVGLSLLKHLSVSLDPGAWYDSDTELFLFTIGDDYPEGIIIDEWKLSCNVDPDVEINADLRYADAWIGLANAADIDEIDTTNGVSTEDTDANINSGSAVANGKVVYIGFDADPEGTCVQMSFEMWFHGEED